MNQKMNLIHEMLLENNFNGSVLIADASGILLDQAYGNADFELNVPNSEKTVYRIASITKQITAAAILQLIEKKKLKLDDTLKMFIPDYPNGEKITIHHLLTHTSGIPNFDLGADFYPVYHAESFDEALIELFKHEPLMFEPGSHYAYSVSGYFLLSYIIKKLTNLSYEAYLKSEIFMPLGMDHSGFDHWRPVIENRAKNYDKIDNRIVHADFIDMRIAGGGGGLISNTKDLYLFQTGLMNHQILSKESVELMFSSQAPIIESTDYGYGVFLAKDEIGGVMRRKNYHTGGGPGVRSVLIDYPDDGIKVIMISNVNDRDTFNHVSEAIENMLFESN